MRRLVPAAALAVVLVAAAFASSARAAAPALKTLATGFPAVQGPQVATAQKSVTAGADTACDPYWASVGVACVSPYELSKVYDYPANLDGSGQTIVLVDAYGSPTLQADVDAFDQAFNLPATTVQIVKAPGTGATDGSGDLPDWAVETSLDVEYAHAMAPRARIVLAQAASDDSDDLTAALAYVLPRYPHAIVSQSFGGSENDPSAGPSELRAHAVYLAATLLGDTLIASAGDFGATNCTNPVLATCDPNAVPVAQFPASDPLVLAVGGTMANPYGAIQGPGLIGSGLYVNGGYGGEQVWNEPWLGSAATGGAPSVLFGATPWQAPFSHSSARIVPDVAYHSSIGGGVEVFALGQEFLVGGTSAAAPQWAAIIAIADEARGLSGIRPLGFASDDIYRIASSPSAYARDFHDITVGDNKLGEVFAGFSAGQGFDDATGLGTPDVANLVADLHGVQPGGNPGVPGPHPSPGGGNGFHGRPHVWSPH